MTEYIPPSENVPIFNDDLFIQPDTSLTVGVADKRYLKFPSAQGAETLSNTTISGTLDVSGATIFSSNIAPQSYADTTAVGDNPQNLITKDYADITYSSTVLLNSVNTWTSENYWDSSALCTYDCFSKFNAGIGYNNNYSVTTSMTLPKSVSSACILVGDIGVTITLSNVDMNGVCYYLTSDAFSFNITVSGTDQIFPYLVSSITVQGNETISLQYRGDGWMQVGGTYGTLSTIRNPLTTTIPIQSDGILNLSTNASTSTIYNIRTVNTNFNNAKNIGWINDSDVVQYYPYGTGTTITGTGTTLSYPLNGYYSVNITGNATIILPSITDKIIGAEIKLRRISNTAFTTSIQTPAGSSQTIWPNSLVNTPTANGTPSQCMSATQYCCIIRCIGTTGWAVVSSD